MKNETSWIPSLNNYSRALRQLKNAFDLADERPLTELEQLGLIHIFEFTHELAWNTLRDFLLDKGNENIYGSKDAVIDGFKYGLIGNKKLWLEMITCRNLSTLSYDDDNVQMVVKAIIKKYLPEFESLHKNLHQLNLKEATL